MPSQMVGTPAVNVTRSRLDQLEQARRVEERPRKDLLGTDQRAAYGKPQALTWNIGTTGSTTSRSPRSPGRRQPMAAKACSAIARCE